MTRTVYKYPLNNLMMLPAGAQVLNVDFQGEQLCLWALVPPKQPMKLERYFLVLPTGHVEIPDDIKMTHIKTVIHEGYVWHVFETNLLMMTGVLVKDGRPTGVGV